MVTIALAGLCAGALIVDRSLQYVIGRDSSFFLYAARVVQQGGVPYRDVWDHKPPGIYYLDVIGLALSDRGLPGVTVIEFAGVLVAALAGFWTLNRTVGLAPALFGSAAWIMAFAIILDGGNRPEEYALPLQFGAIALYVWERRSGPSRWRWIAIGLTAGFASLLKPTVLGVWIAIYLAEAVRAWRDRSARQLAPPVLLGAIGALAVTVPVVLYFVANGAFADLLDQVIQYNLRYSQSSLFEKLVALAAGATPTTYTGLFPFAVAGWLLALNRLLRGSAPARVEPLLLVAVFALPLDLALASATGRPYREYFLGCLCVEGILAAFAASSAGPALDRLASRLKAPPRAVIVASLAVCALVFASAIPTVMTYRRELGPNPQEQTRPAATTYVVDHTAGTEGVLFWGGEAGLNFTTGRRSPTRYAYQYALYMRGYQRPAQIDELLADLQRDPPALIVDASPATTDVPPLDSAARAGWTLQEPKYTVLPEMDRLFRWIDEHYVRVDDVGHLRWPIYAPRRSLRSAEDQRLT